MSYSVGSWNLEVHSTPRDNDEVSPRHSLGHPFRKISASLTMSSTGLVSCGKLL